MAHVHKWLFKAGTLYFFFVEDEDEDEEDWPGAGGRLQAPTRGHVMRMRMRMRRTGPEPADAYGHPTGKDPSIAEAFFRLASLSKPSY